MSERTRRGASTESTTSESEQGGTPGKRTRVEDLVQRKKRGAQSAAEVQSRAAEGVAGPGQDLPFRGEIARAFGSFDVSGVTAHVGGEATKAAADIGAGAYATGQHVAFAEAPDLHTAAHEAAHVVQQRGGVSLLGGVGQEGDVYERHADEVADAVVAGRSAEPILARHADGGAPTTAVQRVPPQELMARGEEVLRRSQEMPESGMNMFLATPPDRSCAIYLLGTEHGLRLRQMVEWRALATILRAIRFTHVLSETTGLPESRRVDIPEDVIGTLGTLLQIDTELERRFPQGGTRMGTRREELDLQGRRNNIPIGGLDTLKLDDVYATLAMTDGAMNERPPRRREFLETDETREQAERTTLEERGRPYVIPTVEETGEQERRFVMVTEAPRREDVEVDRDSVRTGNMRKIFLDQGREMMTGEDKAACDERNKQWMQRVRGVEPGHCQLWIVGAAHLPGLHLRFNEIGWDVQHVPPPRPQVSTTDERRDEERRDDRDENQRRNDNSSNTTVDTVD